MRQVEQIMGMPITVDIPGCAQPKVFNDVFNYFRTIDARFSPYKTDSEVSRYAKGELKEASLSVELKRVIRECKKAEEYTDGFFSAWVNETFDPSGYVKGWAIAGAAKIIKKHDYKTFCVAAGGDLQTGSDGSKDWSIGLQNPKDKSSVIGKVSIKNGAVATSGNYERGKHIFNPQTGALADEILSISVVGPDIIKADVFATAGFAAGLGALEIIEQQPGYEALIINKNGSISMTSGMQQLLTL